MRKLGWIKRDKLKYQAYIRDMDLAVEDLRVTGFVLTSLNDINVAINLLTKEELKSIVKERNLTVSIDNPVRSTYTCIYYKQYL